MSLVSSHRRPLGIVGDYLWAKEEDDLGFWSSRFMAGSGRCEDSDVARAKGEATDAVATAASGQRDA